MSKSKNPMMSLFYMEANNQLPIIKTHLHAFMDNNEFDADALAKALSSFKGAAKIAGIDEVFSTTVEIERLIESISNSQNEINADCKDALLKILEIFQTISTDNEDSQETFDASLQELVELTPLIQLKEEKTSKTSEEKNKSTEVKQKEPKPAVIADLSMLELFRLEAEAQSLNLIGTLIELENDPEDPTRLETLMRAAHSLKGAARMVGLDQVVSIGHVMEDVFVAAQNGKLKITADDMDILLACVDLLANMAKATSEDYAAWCESHTGEINSANSAITAILNGTVESSSITVKNIATSDAKNKATSIEENKVDLNDDNNVRVSTSHLNRLFGIASEAQMESRRLQPYANSLLQIKKQQIELISLMDSLREHMIDMEPNESASETMNAAHEKAGICRDLLSKRLTELENIDRRSNNISHRLNNEIIKIRMRPFSDGTKGFSRLVRDVSRSLNKEIDLKIKGLNTQVDRDILEKLQAPLNHMLRNAIDHGIESQEERLKANKPKTGTITLEAVHTAGMLSISVEDDGRGIDLDNLRQKIIKKKFVSKAMAEKLSESELLDFLFLPNFSTRDNVTEISGRGVGLDVVHTTLQEMRGTIRSSTTLGQGVKFQFQLPLTLSVIRALLVKINNETYAFPLAHINKTLKINLQQIELMEGRQYFTYGSNHIGIITAHQILDLKDTAKLGDEIPVVILGDRINNYAVVVDEFLDERNLAVHTIDSRLGKIQNISSASLTEDGDPLLIFDVEDLLRSIDILLSDGRVSNLSSNKNDDLEQINVKRILVVDDSITVRETERSLLEKQGYHVEVAVDGMDGWNATRTDQYDLIISDIDMPRMNGFELVENIKTDDRFKNIPVIIISYKDREEDRLRGLDVGADYYLTKGSFHDDTFLDAVTDLIGEP